MNVQLCMHVCVTECNLYNIRGVNIAIISFLMLAHKYLKQKQRTPNLTSVAQISKATTFTRHARC